ncbi:cytochrome c [Ammoniphilus sp. CFH 90114]|uniref:c-type cytochrome n=1 Tax=Ammoniphilus sp. CFH 90114 TaxID=2493665 RepID=UPI00100EB482|nr:cytochrome c [Ammoniphilus sp. CFH 90114]RXT14709.1 cytochrome c [Ammoniphilus sp. CFH 90114]
MAKNHHKDEHVDVVNGMKQGHGKIPKVLIFVYTALGVWAVVYALLAGPLDERDTMASATGVSAEAGKALAGQCLACHGADLTGGIGPALVGVIDTLGEDEFIRVMKEGRGSMPALGAAWTEDQMGSMIEYLKTTK